MCVRRGVLKRARALEVSEIPALVPCPAAFSLNGLLLAVLCPASLEKVLVKRLQEQNKGADEVSDRRTAWRRVFNWVDLDKSGIVTPDELGKVRWTTATGATASSASCAPGPCLPCCCGSGV